jgi:hypothetical protein
MVAKTTAAPERVPQGSAREQQMQHPHSHPVVWIFVCQINPNQFAPRFGPCPWTLSFSSTAVANPSLGLTQTSKRRSNRFTTGHLARTRHERRKTDNNRNAKQVDACFAVLAGIGSFLAVFKEGKPYSA